MGVLFTVRRVAATFRNAYFQANLVYLVYAILLLLVDFQTQPAANALYTDDDVRGLTFQRQWESLGAAHNATLLLLSHFCFHYSTTSH